MRVNLFQLSKIAIALSLAAPAGIAHAQNSATHIAKSSQTTSSSFTPKQRKEIVKIVKKALKEDPTILRDALVSLQNNLSRHQRNSALSYVRAHPQQFKDSQEDVVLGNPMGSLTVVEFYDPRCPYCLHVLNDLKTLIAQEPQLRLVEKVIPVLSPKSVLDAQAILAASKQNAYLSFQQALMSNKTAPGMERIRHAAAMAHIDPEQLQHDMHEPAIRDELNRNLDLARAIGLDGTPTFVIGDTTIIPGAASFEELKDVIERVSHNQPLPQGD